MHEIPAFHSIPASRFHYNSWSGPMDHSAAAASAIASEAAAEDSSCSPMDVASQIGFRRPMVSPTRQGLSLSLSSQQTVYRTLSAAEHEIPTTYTSPTAVVLAGNSHSSSASAVVSGGIGVHSVLLGSKYLKIVQELLDEVINVEKEIKAAADKSAERTKTKSTKMTRESTPVIGSEGSSKEGAELTTARRHELEMKKAKLINMLDEVEHRYRQYHHQMHIVNSSFEQAAGCGSAKSYTAIALQTISKQFRCLKNAISAQIKATSKGLGEDDQCLGAKLEGSRLRYVDHQLRQQRALQQLGMNYIQHSNNPWRPQRGLPEPAVSVLRAWLFEHFLHPYPKDSEKVLLAKQTGLTRSQVSNWFINARVRLWKPMVEEMYLEETKDQQEQSDFQGNKSKNKAIKESTSSSATAQETATSFTNLEKMNALLSHPAKLSNHYSSSTTPMGGSFQSQGNTKKPKSFEIQSSPTPRNTILSMDMDGKLSNTKREVDEKFGSERQTKDGNYSLIMGATTSEGSGFGAYDQIGNLGRFQPYRHRLPPRFHGNGVSLTLGLPHCDNNLTLSSQNIPLGNKVDIGIREAELCVINPLHSSSASYENMDIRKRKSFAGQLLPDFVA
ncbi:hypothetical protein FNV43_RR17749 [Rhamnella rubrinervis]|uniref:Homeobox domain-containing protein n=1 Tax=Rhamnella rubrinervis TaxID=2594499 RepID=A0A8K0E372_9ROSA|nr:hypothetical protein FNV43_RR17749 [Rhamnella rubrinervis]